RLSEILEIGRRLFVEIDDLAEAAADCDLVHIDVGRMQQTATFGQRQYRERVHIAFGGKRSAFERIERNVELWPIADANLLADIEHWRLVALALADTTVPRIGRVLSARRIASTA